MELQQVCVDFRHTTVHFWPTVSVILNSSQSLLYDNAIASDSVVETYIVVCIHSH